MTIDLAELNKALSNIENPRYNKTLTFIEKKLGHQGVSSNSYGINNGVQGEYDEYTEIFRLNVLPDLYISLTYITDSYGDGAALSKIQFVQPTEVKVTSFEPIN